MELMSDGRLRVALLGGALMDRELFRQYLEASGLNVRFDNADPSRLLSFLGTEGCEVGVFLVESVEHAAAALREVHQFHPRLPLLVVARGSDPISVQRCFDAGAAGYVDKDASPVSSVPEAINLLGQGRSVFPAQMIESFLKPRQEEGPGPQLLRSLSTREREVLAYLAAGVDNLKIATHLGISERTVKAHVSALYRKLAQENRTQLALLARQLGVRPPTQT